MVVIRVIALIGPLCALAVAAASCGSSTDPQRDAVPPVADVSMSMAQSPTGSDCPEIGVFRLNPMGSSDDVTPRDDLVIRWDFENDGVWDTEYEELAVRLAEPHPLPVAEWTMGCEVRDQAGNVRFLEKTLSLPEWLHVPDDIIAGAVRIHARDVPFTAVDTLRVGQLFDVMVAHREWVSTGGSSMTIAIYVDGVLAQTLGASTTYPSWQICHSSGAGIADGFATPGLHEVRAVVDAGDSITESNEDNNTAETLVVVVE